jgi:predicted NBD/HSP70 family sugar kinase
MSVISKDIARNSLIPAAFRRRAESETVSPNERWLLELIRRNQVTNRADLTRATDLSPQSISRLVDALAERGFVTFGEKLGHGRGQPSLAVRLAPEAAYSVGISITTDQLSLSLMSFDGTVITERQVVIPGMAITTAIDTVRQCLREIVDEIKIDQSRIFGFGVAISGFFAADGRINPPDPLAHWGKVAIDQVFMEAFSLPVWVENDGAASAIGESLFGIGLEIKSFAYLYFTYGFGGGVVQDGKLVRGAHGNAAEFSAILSPQRHEERPTLELLRRILNDHGVMLTSIAELIETFNPDWPGIDVWLERVRGPLSDIVSAISGVLDPQAIVLGGAIPKPLALRLMNYAEFYNRRRRGETRPTPRIMVSPMNGNVTAIGAAAMPLKYSFFE